MNKKILTKKNILFSIVLFVLNFSIVLCSDLNVTYDSNGDLKKIFPNDKRIHITGAEFSKISNSIIDLQRHSDSALSLPIYQSKFNPARAKTTTGIVISFKTKSPDIKIQFKMLPGVQRNGLFAVYQNEILSGTYSITPNDDSLITIDVHSLNTSSEVLYKITLPTWNNLAFTGLEVKDGYDLINYQPEGKKVYIAYGNSITHGTGQKGTHETYAYQVANKFGWKLYNVAVGGAKTSVAIAEMLRDNFRQIDYLTILIGYNDYNGEGIDTLEYKKRYSVFLRTIRSKHKETKIFCITQTFTTQSVSKKTGIPVEDFRKVVRNIVANLKSKGDKDLFLIEGEKITNKSGLKDAVHFNVEGAAAFAESLANKIKEKLAKK